MTIRNYRIVGKSNSYLMGLGSGASQKRSKRIVATEKLPRANDGGTILLKGTFIFEDNTFTFNDAWQINVGGDNAPFGDTMLFSDSLIITKEE